MALRVLSVCVTAPLSVLFYILFQLDYEEVIAEPDGIKSIDCVWNCSFKCFNLWKNLCYQILTLLCGMCIAACWGCEFAILAFEHIWHWTPCFKCVEMQVLAIKKFFSLLVHCVCDPCCEAIGLIFEAFRK